MAYCGSPEPLDKTETGRHGILYGEIDPEIGQVTTLDFIPMAKLRYIPLIVRVTPDTTNTELYLKSPMRSNSAAMTIFSASRCRACAIPIFPSIWTP